MIDIKEIFINMEKEIFRGNLLDIGRDNYGIIYNIYKKYNDDINLEYVTGEQEKENIKENYYDNCILLFSFSNIFLKKNKTKILEDIYKFLKKDGCIYIWDIDKGINKTFNSKVKIVIPDGKIKEIFIKDLNLFKDSSSDTCVKLLETYFKMEEFKKSDGIYYIKARKINNNKDMTVRKGEKHENNFSCN
ncbi:class I SAM-dependent methyltransferase [Clostridium niameyense]|uniref:Class I SAM-dependent methyltransferase n=2 Tax=Clostridium niameyense TaxID=1622073 RepID=A0A6M0R8K9_9CLOT|nr:class I SAM-dependent methyltransferase [Clostridium niameyense]